MQYTSEVLREASIDKVKRKLSLTLVNDGVKGVMRAAHPDSTYVMQMAEKKTLGGMLEYFQHLSNRQSELPREIRHNVTTTLKNALQSAASSHDCTAEMAVAMNAGKQAQMV